MWPLGQAFNVIKDQGPQAHTFTITAEGPFGAVPPLTYVVDLADWRGLLDRPRGNLHQLTLAVKDLTKTVHLLLALVNSSEENRSPLMQVVPRNQHPEDFP
jgi:hypothetical protein